MAATPRTTRTKRAAPPQANPTPGMAGERRVPPALQEITLTEVEAAELERIMARPSTLRPEYAPRPIPDADPALLD